jgi:hypothetical protein
MNLDPAAIGACIDAVRLGSPAQTAASRLAERYRGRRGGKLHQEILRRLGGLLEEART